MPATALELVDVARRYQIAQMALTSRATSAMEAAWGLYGGLTEEAAASWLERAVPLAEAAQIQAAQIEASSMASYLGAALDEPIRMIDVSVTSLRVGVTVDEVYRRPIIEARKAIARGGTFREAMAAGRTKASLLIDTDLGLARRRAATDAMNNESRVVGYRRIPNSQACRFCLTASTQRYHAGSLMPLHPRCACSQAPIVGTIDPGQVIDGELLDRLKAAERESGAHGRGLGQAVKRSEESINRADRRIAELRTELRNEADGDRRERLAERLDNWRDRKREAEQELARRQQRLAESRRRKPETTTHPELGPVLVAHGN